MKANNLVRYILAFLLFVILHVLLVKYFVFYGVAFCFLYIGFLMILPLSMPVPLVLLIAFLLGLFVDLFYDTAGIHAAACVGIMYIRPAIVTLLTPLGGYDEASDFSIRSMGFTWFAVFTIIFCFMHHTFVFILEAFGFDYFYWTLAKIITSTLFSSFMIVSLSYLVLTSKTK